MKKFLELTRGTAFSAYIASLAGELEDQLVHYRRKGVLRSTHSELSPSKLVLEFALDCHLQYGLSCE